MQSFIEIDLKLRP